MHLVDEVPVEYTDTRPVTPGTKYGVPSTGSSNSPRAPSPTYGVPGQTPGIPSNYIPNEFQRPAPPSPTYGVPTNAYIPPPPPPSLPSKVQNFQPNTQQFNSQRFPSTSSASAADEGYVYKRPLAKLENPRAAQLRAKTTDEEDDDSKSGEEEDDSIQNTIQLTTEKPSSAPEFFFSEQFDRTPPTQTVPLTSPQQQPVFHPEEQPFLPNSPPAPFSTAVYQEFNRRAEKQNLDPIPTLARETLPPAVDAKNYYRSDLVPAQSQTQYNQAEWFRRISRSATTNQTEIPIEETGKPTADAKFIEELRKKEETLRILFPEKEPEGGEEFEDEDLIIDFGAVARATIGNRTSRIKRQTFSSNPMCETTKQFIEPQVALARDGEYYNLDGFYNVCGVLKSGMFTGEWKFIVNQVESARQLVQVEYCA